MQGLILKRSISYSHKKFQPSMKGEISDECPKSLVMSGKGIFNFLCGGYEFFLEQTNIYLEQTNYYN